jgi:DNA-directed RNA polymerase specialized sigma24 family protein
MQLFDARVISPSQTALADKLVSEMDLLRLKAIARLHARGLPPDVAWNDLLQEALTRVLTGARVRPEGVTMVAFVAGIMRSIRSEYWRRARSGPSGRDALRLGRLADDSADVTLREVAPDPERSLLALEELDAIQRLFADDPVVLQIITGLGEGFLPDEIRDALGLSRTEYNSARRRMRRCLLREGLTCGTI